MFTVYLNVKNKTIFYPTLRYFAKSWDFSRVILGFLKIPGGFSKKNLEKSQDLAKYPKVR